MNISKVIKTKLFKPVFSRFFIFTILFYNNAYANNDFWNELATRPDVKITVDKKTKLRTANFSGGVVVNETKEGGYVGVDKSGHGAILCTWMMLVHVKNMTDICSPESKNIFKEMINGYVDKYNDFIIENSLSIVTKQQLEEQINNKLLTLKERTGNMNNKQLAEQCMLYDFIKIMEKKKSNMSLEEFTELQIKNENAINNSLALSRPAVGNPCL